MLSCWPAMLWRVILLTLTKHFSGGMHSMVVQTPAARSGRLGMIWAKAAAGHCYDVGRLSLQKPAYAVRVLNSCGGEALQVSADVC